MADVTITIDGFNSTLVRLKALTLVASSTTAAKFQFHIGTIKSEQRNVALTMRNRQFQFHIGTIKSDNFNFLNNLLNNVSIPHWYD